MENRIYMLIVICFLAILLFISWMERQNGRYQITNATAEGGVYLVDTKTGEIHFCLAKGKWINIGRPKVEGVDNQ
jgi:hypothetical protein